MHRGPATLCGASEQAACRTTAMRVAYAKLVSAASFTLDVSSAQSMISCALSCALITTTVQLPLVMSVHRASQALFVNVFEIQKRLAPRASLPKQAVQRTMAKHAHHLTSWQHCGVQSCGTDESASHTSPAALSTSRRRPRPQLTCTMHRTYQKMWRAAPAP